VSKNVDKTVRAILAHQSIHATSVHALVFGAQDIRVSVEKERYCLLNIGSKLWFHSRSPKTRSDRGTHAFVHVVERRKRKLLE
jgi:hypothetical protein